MRNKGSFKALWPAGQIELLERLWRGKFTAAEIAAEMAANGFPVTRNAVIGKAHRLDLPMRSKSHSKGGPKPRKDRMVTIKPKPAIDALISLPQFIGEPVDGSPVEYMKLRSHHCRALLDQRGGDGLLLSCGRLKGYTSTGAESSYYPEHERRYHQPRAAGGR